MARILETGRWAARTTDGKKVIVVALTKYLGTENFEGSGETEGIVSLQTSTGIKLNHKGKGEYETYLGERIRSSDPSAP
jgi:hypothetical protein